MTFEKLRDLYLEVRQGKQELIPFCFQYHLFRSGTAIPFEAFIYVFRFWIQTVSTVQLFNILDKEFEICVLYGKQVGQTPPQELLHFKYEAPLT